MRAAIVVGLLAGIAGSAVLWLMWPTAELASPVAQPRAGNGPVHAITNLGAERAPMAEAAATPEAGANESARAEVSELRPGAMVLKVVDELQQPLPEARATLLADGIEE